MLETDIKQVGIRHFVAFSQCQRTKDNIRLEYLNTEYYSIEIYTLATLIGIKYVYTFMQISNQQHNTYYHASY